MTEKSEDKIHENKKSVNKGIRRPMITDGGRGKKFKKYFFVEDIEHQQKKEKMTELQRMKELAHLCLRIG